MNEFDEIIYESEEESRLSIISLDWLNLSFFMISYIKSISK